MFKCNENMKKTLNEIGEVGFGKIWPEFKELNGFIILKKNDKSFKEFDEDKILAVYYDRTGFEASYNEFRIEDYFQYFIKKPEEGVILAIKLSEIWECELKRKFPNYKFHIIVGFDGQYTTIRFHKLRDDEESWIDLDCLNEYRNESIALRIVE